MGTMKMNHLTGTSPSRRSRLLALVAAAVACLAAAVFAAPASAAFGISAFDGTLVERDGTPTSQAGAHPYEITTVVNFNRLQSTKYGEMPDEAVKDVTVNLAPGFIGNPTAAAQCSEYDLAGHGVEPTCSTDSIIGMVELGLNTFGFEQTIHLALFNMVVPPGTPSSFGFNVFGVPVHLYSRLRSDSDYGISVDVPNINQTLAILSSTTRIWGVPSDPGHDNQRCTQPSSSTGFCENLGDPRGSPHPGPVPAKAFLTNVTDCAAGPQLTTGRADSWLHPGVFAEASFVNHDGSEPPLPVATSGCNVVPFTPTISGRPTADRAESPSGFNFVLSMPTTGLESPTSLAQSTIKKATVTLPEGMTINPSAGEGLGVCTEADFARETAISQQGEGCPNSSKVGTVKIETPLLKEEATGALYIAKQYDNPFHSLLALYIVAKIPDRGVLVKVPGKVTPDPRTGQLTTTFDNLPQLPFSKFTLSFREGQRSPLTTPPACGAYTVNADFVPWSATDPNNPAPGEIAHREDSFRVTQGVGGGGCPAGNAQRPFKPFMQAGTLNNNAGSYSPVTVRMSRNDGEQEITSFSAKLPQGLIGKLAGIPYCSDADIAKAATKTGTEENANPSCPAASLVGRTLVGAGVGSVLAYAPGKVYLAGPYHGSPISIAAITSATVGPFDLGTVVVRSAFKVNPETAAVSVDSAGSDPIPHIMQGIQLHVRDVRVYMDRPDFTLNPTSCDPFAFEATLTGSGADTASSADDVAANVNSPFQASNCSRLGFAPRLAFRLKGGTHRGDYPALQATLTARPGDANIAKAAVTLPHSEFLAQEHIRTVCTRVQFAADQCPAASVYGRAQAVTPLFDKPLEGPVYLRSSSNPLPDLVAKLDGQIQVNLVGRIDSVNQGIRNTFDVVPDAPVTRFTLQMQGGKKSLLVNSRNLCKSPGRAEVKMTGQNGKTSLTRPVVANKCKKARQGKRAKGHKRNHR
jgi:hypothetical protein